METFSDLIKTGEFDLVRTLAVGVNLGGKFAEEICKRSGIKKNTKIEELSNSDIEKVFIEMSNFLELFEKKKFQPVLVKKDDELIDILSFEFKSYENVDFVSLRLGNSTYPDLDQDFVSKQPIRFV